MGFPFCYSLRNSEHLVHSLLRPTMIELSRNLEFVCEEIVLKVIRRDIVIRFDSLTFSWTSLSGFRSTGIPFFAQVSLSGFRPAVCTYLFIFITYFCLNPFGSPGSPYFCLGQST